MGTCRGLHIVVSLELIQEVGGDLVVWCEVGGALAR